MVIPFGSLIERTMGSKKVSCLIVSAWFVTSLVFKLMFWNRQETATGISGIGYSFGLVALTCILLHKDKIAKKQRICYYILLALMASMLIPQVTGWVSFGLHMTGLLIGGCFA